MDRSGRPIIGVFDSGVGGLTVLSELLAQVPGADYLYFGDTARLPYGAKSSRTVARYAVSSAQFLMERGAEMLVIACNTASALALDEIGAQCPVPVQGVIEPGAETASRVSRSGEVAVIATAATVASHAYAGALSGRGLRAIEMACPLFVPLVEEGWTNHPVTRQVAEIYLQELRLLAQAEGLAPDVFVLGCTHYPLLKPLLRDLLAGTELVDSAEATARKVGERLPHLRNGGGTPQVEFYATDSVERFQFLGQKFLGRPIEQVKLADLGG